VGTKPNEVAAHLATHGAKSPLVNIEASRSGARLALTAEAAARNLGGVAVYVVTYRPVSTVEIQRGENAGRTFDYANVVTSWTEAQPWNGVGRYDLSATVPEGEPAVVLFQRDGHGEIIGAVALR
ncbi:MAG: DUF1223 domain-containing protein, partial [Pseudomonadota bacterium]